MFYTQNIRTPRTPTPQKCFKNETKYKNKTNENVDSQSNRKQKVNHQPTNRSNSGEKPNIHCTEEYSKRIVSNKITFFNSWFCIRQSYNHADIKMKYLS